MKIYISGISGTGMGALALFAKEAGYEVFGSDLNPGPVVKELEAAGIQFKIGPEAQDGRWLQECIDQGVEWFVYTSALPADHTELVLAGEKLKCTKRDGLISEIVRDKGLKMVAVAGTHGKTTTTAMIIWACHKLHIPVSYLVGSNLPFGPAGKFDPQAKYFIYEADEYDRNFLHYHPWLAAITVIDYDHPDVYPTLEAYRQAFLDFENQSEQVIRTNETDAELTLPGELRRLDATLAMDAVTRIAADSDYKLDHARLVKVMNDFPGVLRRFERLLPGIYTDYAHHPSEIAAVLEAAEETAAREGYTGVIAIYEPHQNTRQHAIRDQYKNAFDAATMVYWLPTYLTREDPNLRILAPDDLIMDLESPSIAKVVGNEEQLVGWLRQDYADNYLIILLSAGPADAWLRGIIKDGYFDFKRRWEAEAKAKAAAKAEKASTKQKKSAKTTKKATN